jgi:hypothetical protein
MNIEAALKKKKQSLIFEMDMLDKLSEHQELSQVEMENKKVMWAELERIWRMEEVKARQRSREREIKEEDGNTSYFFAKSNQRRKRKMVSCLENEGEVVTHNKDMIDHALEFYKSYLVKKKSQISPWIMSSERIMRKCLLKKT